MTDTRGEPKSDVAVVIPYYNGSHYIRRSIESVLSQSVRPAEFIIVNDGSREEEARFLHNLAGELDLQVVDKKNGGQGSARNAGVMATKSPYICFLDQDDFYLPEHIEVLRSAIPQEDRRFGWAYADLMEADGEGNIVRTAMVKEHSEHPKRNIMNLLGQDMFVLPSASIVSRIAFEAVDGFDPQFMGYEDDDLFLRIFRAGFSNIFVDRSVAVWCINPESTSYSIRMSRSRFRYFKKLCQFYPNDAHRARYVLRDVLIPRWRRVFIAEPFLAICRPDTPQGQRLSPHKDELLSIAKEFRDIAIADKYLRRRDKLIIRAQVAVLALRSKLIGQLAFYSAQGFRFFLSRLTLRI